MNCSPPPPINLTVKFLQINLRHGRLASATFAQTLLDLDIDIALIQEPYATQVDPKLPPNMHFLPDAYEALHKLDSNHHFGAAIVAKGHSIVAFYPITLKIMSPQPWLNLTATPSYSARCTFALPFPLLKLNSALCSQDPQSLWLGL